MNSLAVFEFDYSGSTVRSTEDRRFSVYDVLVAFGVADKPSNAKNVYDRLAASNLELTTICSKFKFPGRGQRDTPVATEEGIYQILMLCPGQRGAEFRAWAAGILADPDKALTHAVSKYKRQGRSDNWIKARLDGKLNRRHFTDTLKEHGVEGIGYAKCSDAINVPILGAPAKQIQQARGVVHTRDGLDDVELAAISLAEAVARRSIDQDSRWGNSQCEEACGDAARKVKRVFE
jgi:prophage antirepressor-like protein